MEILNNDDGSMKMKRIATTCTVIRSLAFIYFDASSMMTENMIISFSSDVDPVRINPDPYPEV